MVIGDNNMERAIVRCCARHLNGNLSCAWGLVGRPNAFPRIRILHSGRVSFDETPRPRPIYVRWTSFRVPSSYSKMEVENESLHLVFIRPLWLSSKPGLTLDSPSPLHLHFLHPFRYDRLQIDSFCLHCRGFRHWTRVRGAFW